MVPCACTQGAPRILDVTLSGIHLEWDAAELGDHDDVIAGYVVQWKLASHGGAAASGGDPAEGAWGARGLLVLRFLSGGGRMVWRLARLPSDLSIDV